MFGLWARLVTQFQGQILRAAADMPRCADMPRGAATSTITVEIHFIDMSLHFLHNPREQKHTHIPEMHVHIIINYTVILNSGHFFPK